MLPAPNRLRTRADFATAVRGPAVARAGSPLLVVHASRPAPRVDCPPRVGFVVSKAVGGAVVRNRTKRRLRALMAARVDRFPGGADLVVRANPPAAQASYADLEAALDPLLHRVIHRLEERR